MNVREQAKMYLGLGWSVLPIKPNAKVPSSPWNEYRKRQMTHEEVDRLFTDDSNIAVACGELSGIMVIDQDLYKGKPGLENVDSPLKAYTPRGGIHAYFKYSKGTQNTVNENVGTDIRSEGGYVLIPSSKVSFDKDGTEAIGAYLWLTEPTKELLESLPEAPKSLLEAVYAPVTTQTPTPTNYEAPGVDYASLRGMPEGGRNNAISRAALSIVSKLKNPELAWQTIQSINQGFTPPLPEAELRATFDSAVKRYQVSPPVNPNSSVSNSPLLQDAVVLSDHTVSSTAEDIQNAILTLASGKKKGLSSGYERMDAIMGGFLPGQSYLLYADTSVGKSMFAVNMLVSLAERGIKCLYFDLENDMTMTMERLMFVANRGRVNLTDYRSRFAGETVDVEYLKKIFTPVIGLQENLFVWDLVKLTERFGDITWAGVQKCIDEEMKKGVQIIMIDHLHYFSPGETDHAVLGEIARQVNNIASTHNISILLVAHTKKGLIEVDKKGDGDSVKANRPTIEFISGSAMISKHFKNIIAIQRNSMADTEEERTRTMVYIDKTKYGAAGKFQLVYDEKTLLFLNDSPTSYATSAKLKAIDETLNSPQAALLEFEAGEPVPDNVDEGVVDEPEVVEVKIVPPVVEEEPEPVKEEVVFVPPKKTIKTEDYGVKYKEAAAEIQDIPF